VSRVAWPPELSYEARINSLGLRGPEVDRQPALGTVRILALGDSGTFGFYVAEDQTLPAQLEAGLQAADWPAEVINGGCGGWSIDSETLFLEERAAALEPAVVVLTFGGNDISDLEGDHPAVYESMVAQLGSGGGLKQSLYDTALYELVLRIKVAHKRWRQERAGEVPHPLSSADVPAERLGPLWAEYGEWLRRMQAFLDERGVPLVVLYQPDAHRLANGLPHTDLDRLRALCAELELPLVAPLEPFAAQPVEELYHVPLDPHPNAEGYRILAAHVTAYLVEHRSELGLDE
jgi:lysophospholipase L1-like esterase